MDKYEYNLKIDQLKTAVAKNDGKSAAAIADEFDWKREKDTSLLTAAADAYELNQEYAKAKELLIFVYEKNPTSKHIAYRLTLLAANTGEFDEAMEFYQDFVELAPRDTSRYILQYRISRAQNMPIEELICILEEFLEDEMEEKWMYELAKLYHEAGYVDKCVDLCDEMSLWFSHGKYVRRALDLKKLYKPLSKSQEENYNKTDETPYDIKEDSPLEITAEVPIDEVINREKKDEVVKPTQILKEDDEEEVKSQPTIPFTTMKMDEIRKNLKSYGVSEVTAELPSNAFPGMEDKVATDEKTADLDALEVVDEHMTKEEAEILVDETPEEVVAETEIKVATQKLSDTADFEPVTDEAEIKPVSDTAKLKQQSIMDIIVEPHKQITEPMREVVPDIDVNEIKIPTPDVSGVAEVQEGIAADIQKFMDNDVVANRKQDTKTTKVAMKDIIKEEVLKAEQNVQTEEQQTQAFNATDIVNEEAAQASEDVQEGEELTLDEPEDRLSMTLDPMFKYEANGQIGLDFDEPKKPDKEITGQLSIEEVLRSLEKRGILKAETVNEAVEALDKAEMVANKASVEVAQAEEEAKLNETVVEEIKVEDLGGPIEAEEDTDEVSGFEFTDEVDKEAIQNAVEAAERYEKEMQLVEEDKLAQEAEAAVKEDEPVEIEDEADDQSILEALLAGAEEDADDTASDEEEIPVELDTRPTEDIPILDLSFDAPVKKLHPGIAPTKEPVAASTASLEELFADLDEATKREIGIDVVEDDFAKDESEEDSDFLAEGDTSAVEEVAEEETSEEKAEEENNTDAEETETVDKKDNNEDDEESVEIDVEVDEQLEIRENKNIKHIEQPSETDTEEMSEEEEVDSEAEEATEHTAELPKISVSRNENLSATRSLNLDKVVVSDQEMEPFESFKPINGMEQKIKDTVVSLTVDFEADGNSKRGNIMILGDEKSGKTTLAIELIKLINKKRERGGRRIAKVDSAILNTRGIRSSMKKLVGSDLIVENAQYLRKSVLNEFVAISKYYTDDMLMVFEGETAAMKKMRGENPDIEDMFDHLLVIKEYDVKEWVAYAKNYAADENYMIDEMGILALYKAIDDFYSRHQGIDQNDVETIINRAIKRASKKVTRKITNLFSGKNDENGMDILKESDFK
ncbi:MAG: hypothetical protein IKN54_00970 [Lachnospiraceae bacterium]|nr:hypothetical protein [Lachnospiraceae bacterium]